MQNWPTLRDSWYNKPAQHFRWDMLHTSPQVGDSLSHVTLLTILTAQLRYFLGPEMWKSGGWLGGGKYLSWSQIYSSVQKRYKENPE